jgi:hypothetical protein
MGGKFDFSTLPRMDDEEASNSPDETGSLAKLARDKMGSKAEGYAGLKGQMKKAAGENVLAAISAHDPEAFMKHLHHAMGLRDTDESSGSE